MTTPGGEQPDGVDLPTGLAVLTERPTGGAAVWPISPAAAFVTGAGGQAIVAEHGFGAS